MVVGRFSKELILPAIKTASLRFGEIVHLKRELTQLRRRGSERKLVEKAGDLLIVQGLSEEEAFSSLRNTAMNSRLKLVEMAKRLVEHGEITR
ncbi:MAG: ANTAR domain-containing protein [Methylohalobius sp.]|nr:ANTAR domain-containing protein [Methylohalobius sp.]